MMMLWMGMLFLFVRMFNFPVNNYGYVEMVSNPRWGCIIITFWINRFKIVFFFKLKLKDHVL